MFRYLFAIMLTVTMLTGSAMSAEPNKADAAYGVKYTEGRVVKLPQDQDKIYVTVFGTPNNARFEQVKGWFNTVPELKAIRAQVHYNVYPTTSTEYKERLGKSVGNKPLPMIRVQYGKSMKWERILEISGDNVPMSGEALTNHINTECLRRWRQRCCPCPKPDTNPDDGVLEGDADAPADEDQTDVKPDLIPVDEGPDMTLLAGIVAVCLLAGSGGAFVNTIKNSNPFGSTKK